MKSYKKAPTEAQEQEAFFKWANYHPIARKAYAIPNDGIRTPAQGARFKRRGLKAGVPDTTLPVASKGYHGLYIEFKRKGCKNRLTPAQRDRIAELNADGYLAVVVDDWEEAKNITLKYLSAD